MSHVLLTHWHLDHAGGTQDLLGLYPDAVIYKHQTSKLQVDIPNGYVFQVEGATLRSFHCPGHTVDHTAFVLEEENAMFTGDNVLGHGTAVFEDLAVYLQSLNLMKQQFSGRAYPGHGDFITDGVAKLDEYIKHRQQREDQVLQNLNDGSPRTPMELVKVIYRDFPENLHEPAAQGISQILHKLKDQGKVVCIEEGARWQIGEKPAL